MTSGGRVVILDFGLASDAFPETRPRGRAWPARRRTWRPNDVRVPRRLKAMTGIASASPCTKRSRAGCRSTDRFEHTLLRERAPDLHPPADVAPDVPEDLNAICMGLLRRDPAHRLSGSEALRLLERDAGGGTGTPPSDDEIEPPFIGRRRHLDTLAAALGAAKSGSATAVYVHGPPASARAPWSSAFSRT